MYRRDDHLKSPCTVVRQKLGPYFLDKYAQVVMMKMEPQSKSILYGFSACSSFALGPSMKL